MAEFKDDPVLVLDTMEQVREAMTHNRNGLCGFKGGDIYRVKSLWLISLIEEIAAKEYPYNATVKRLAEQRLEMPPKTWAEYSRENDSLSLLIYNAQCYRRSDKLRADGFEPFTNGVIKQAYQLGKKLEVLSQGLIGSSILTLNVREIEGTLYAMKPRARNKHVAPYGQPVRMKG